MLDWFDMNWLGLFSLPDLANAPSWYFWGFVLLVGHPILVVLLGELIHALRNTGRADIIRPLTLIRNGVLSSGFIVILLRWILEFDSSHILVRIADTIFLILTINACLSMFNAFFFNEGASDGWRGRMPKLFLDLSRLFLAAFGAAIVISTVWGVDLSGMMAALGVGSVVIGLALQDTLGSLISGIALLSARFFKVGDWIAVEGQEGKVTAMSWRTVQIQTREGDSLVFPNVVLQREKVRNFTDATGFHVESINMHLSFEHPPEKVKDLMVEAAISTPNVLLTPRPDPRLVEFGEYAVEYQVRVSVRDYAHIPVVRSDFQSIFWYMAEREGLDFPARFHKFYLKPDILPNASERTPLALAGLIRELRTFPLSERKLLRLTKNATIERYRKGEFLIEQGHVANAFYLIFSGETVAQLDVSLFMDQDTEEEIHTPDDHDIEVHTYGRGQYILFKSLIRDDVSPLNVMATSNVDVISIPPEDFKTFLVDNPDMAREIEEILSKREDVEERIRNTTLAGFKDDSADHAKLLNKMFLN